MSAYITELSDMVNTIFIIIIFIIIFITIIIIFIINKKSAHITDMATITTTRCRPVTPWLENQTN